MLRLGLGPSRRVGAAVRARGGYLYPFWDAIDSVEFSPDGALVLTSSRDETARIWSVASGLLLLSMERSGQSATFSPDGSVVVDGAGRMWDAQSGRVLRTLGSWNDCRAVFSADSSLVVTGYDVEARIWDVASGRRLQTLDEDHFYRVDDIAISPDGTLVATNDDQDRTRIWEVASGRLLHTLEVDETPSMFSPDSTLLLSSILSGGARIWDVINGHLLKTLDGTVRGPGYGPAFPAFSPDFRMLVTAENDGTAQVWDLGTDSLLSELADQGHWFSSANFRSDGTLVVTAVSAEGQILGETDGRLMHTLEGHTQAVISSALSADGTLAATASVDGSARIWDAATGVCLHTLRPEPVSRPRGWYPGLDRAG